MILNKLVMIDNFTMMRGLVKTFIAVLFVLFFNNCAFALEKVGILTDTILTPVTYYNSYFRTPEFFAQDVRTALSKRNVQVIPIDEVKDALLKSGLKQNDLQVLQALQQGYDIDYKFLSKVAKKLNVKKIIIVTMGMDVQRDFLKTTLWNHLNIAGMDVVNPTHRVSIYAGLFDVENKNVLWESIYAKNIRNNKMKNLDTAISNNYEGMLRLKEYSKYISPDIAYNVKMKLLNPNYVEPPTHITRENIKQYAKDKHNIGSKKELSEIERKKWDTDKLINDTKDNVIEKTNMAKDKVIETSDSLRVKFVRFKNNLKTKMKNKQKVDWL